MSTTKYAAFSCCVLGTLGLSGGASVWGEIPFTYETPTELSSIGDFDADGRVDMVILDRETGVLRILLQQATGDFEPGVSPRSGLEAADALAVGKLQDGGVGDHVTLASVRSNRLLAFGFTPTSAEVVPLQDLLSPAALAVVSRTALPPGLLVATEENDAPSPRRLSLFAAAGGALQEVADSSVAQPAPLRRGNGIVMRREETPTMAAFVVCASEEASEFHVVPETAAGVAPTVSSTDGLPASAQWTYGFFAPLKQNPAFLFYQRGTSTFTSHQAEEPTPRQYTFTETGNFDFGKAIHLLLTINYEHKSWLLALLDDGRAAGLYEFDAVGAPRVRQQWSAPPGETFTTAAALGEGGFMLLSGVGGRSAQWHRFDYDGSRHRRSSSGALAPLSARDRQITVFLFDQEPFVVSGAKVLELRREGDWSTDIEPLLPGSWRLTTLRDRGLVDGLGVSETGVFVYSDRLFPVINQHLRPMAREHDLPLSIASFSAQNGAVSPSVQFDPPPGTYPDALSQVENFPPSSDPEAPVAEAAGAGLPVRLSSSAGASTIYYRFSAEEPWQTYSAPLRLSASTTIYARTISEYPEPGTASAVVSGRWVLGGASSPRPPLEEPAMADANRNGLDDAWESAFNQHDPNADPDGDGLTNLEEYLAGTDPLDPGDLPVQPTAPRPELTLNYQVVVDDATPCLELSWDSANADAILLYSSDMENWQPIREGIEFSEEACRALVPLDSPAASGYFRLTRDK